MNCSVTCVAAGRSGERLFWAYYFTNLHVVQEWAWRTTIGVVMKHENTRKPSGYWNVLFFCQLPTWRDHQGFNLMGENYIGFQKWAGESVLCNYFNWIRWIEATWINVNEIMTVWQCDSFSRKNMSIVYAERCRFAVPHANQELLNSQRFNFRWNNSCQHKHINTSITPLHYQCVVLHHTVILSADRAYIQILPKLLEHSRSEGS